MFHFPLCFTSGGFDSRPFVRGAPGRSVSMRTPTKPRDALSKVLPLRWSFGSKSRRKPAPAHLEPAATPAPPVELVEYLESGRRPRCTKDPIVTLVGSPSTREVPQGQQPPTTSSSSSLSCVGREPEEQGDSVRAPEGQQRPGGDKTGTLRRSSTNVKQQQQQREEGTLGRRSGRTERKQEQGKSHDSHSRRGSNVGIQSSPSTPASLGSSQQRSKGGGGDVEGEEEGDKGRRGEESKSHDGLLSFLKGGFLKRDSVRRSRDSDWGRGSEAASRSLSKLSLSNGGPGSGGGTTEAKASSGGGRGRRSDELANGKVSRGSMPDIKRSQSSSNIQSKADSSLRRTASLHRNGLSAAPAPSRSLTADRASCGTLQRSRYSSTSLGRKRTVPESSF